MSRRLVFVLRYVNFPEELGERRKATDGVRPQILPQKKSLTYLCPNPIKAFNADHPRWELAADSLMVMDARQQSSDCQALPPRITPNQ